MPLTSAQLAGGHLVEVLTEVMFTPEQAGILRRYARRPDARKQEIFTKFFGWCPPVEVAEFSGIFSAYKQRPPVPADPWTFDDPLASAVAGTKRKTWAPGAYAWTLLTGLLPFGRDKAGSLCAINTLPGPATAEVYLYHHQIGMVDERTPSIACFLARWSASETTPAGVANGALALQLATAHRPTVSTRALQEHPVRLHGRVEWLVPLLIGHGPHNLSNLFRSAPGFADWLTEKPLLPQHPILANYWVLAHFVLGNDQACAEAIALARQCPGRVTTALCDLVEQRGVPYLTRELCYEVAKLAHERLHPPVTTRTMRDAPDSTTLLQRLAAGEDGWSLIAETDEVEAQNRLLDAIPDDDDSIRRYGFSRRREPYMPWPEKSSRYHQRFSPVVVAAFRAGLRFSIDHPKAFAGLTQTLSLVEGDTAIDVAREAFATLAVDDDRLAWLCHWLEHSPHPQAGATLAVGARRFFDTLAHARQLDDQRRSQGNTLNAMAMSGSYLAEALRSTLRRGDADASALAARTLTFTTDLHLFADGLGLAVRIAARDRSPAVAAWAKTYATMVLARRSDAEHIERDAGFNLAECALAMARLTPQDALPWLKEAFDAPRPHEKADLSIRAALLAGLLMCEPGNSTWRTWAERFVVSSTCEMRAHHALRGIEDAGIAVPVDWLAPHVRAAADRRDTAATSGYFGDEDRWLITVARLARRIATRLGHPPFPEPHDQSDD